MALPTAIGATIKNSITQLNTVINTSTWVPVLPVTVDSNNNVGMATSNDGTVTNTTGSEQEYEGVIALVDFTDANLNYALAIGLYNGSSWSVVSADGQGVFNGLWWYGKTLRYKITVPDGYKIGLLAKAIGSAQTHYSYHYVHFSKTVDGVADPKLSIACSTVTTSYHLISTTTSYSRFSPVTTEYAGAIGASSDQGRITNESGETLMVDGWMFLMEYFDGLIAAGFQTTAYLNGAAITSVDRVELDGFNFSSSVYIRPVFIYWSAELADGDYIDPVMKNTAAGTYDFWMFGSQFTARSRT